MPTITELEPAHGCGDGREIRRWCYVDAAGTFSGIPGATVTKATLAQIYRGIQVGTTTVVISVEPLKGR